VPSFVPLTQIAVPKRVRCGPFGAAFCGVGDRQFLLMTEFNRGACVSLVDSSISGVGERYLRGSNLANFRKELRALQEKERGYVYKLIPRSRHFLYDKSKTTIESEECEGLFSGASLRR
jgi:hypothetical protein